MVGELGRRRSRSPDVGDPARAIDVDHTHLLCETFVIVQDGNVR